MSTAGRVSEPLPDERLSVAHLALGNVPVAPPPSFDRLLSSPEFWKGLCAARDERNPDDHRLIASYERAEAALRAEPERDPRTVPEVVDWLARRAGNQSGRKV